MNQGLFAFGAAFLGGAVESVEALTIVLAVGLTRGWRAPLRGTVAALVVLAVLVATLGGLITTTVPEQTLKLVIGSLVLLFGWRWLHKAVLRSAGVIALHDEEKEYRETVAEARAATDWAGFVIAFKGVFLEGLEVAFIVFAVGASGHTMPWAIGGGLSAMAVVAALGVVIRHPLAKVPENLLKHGVGLLLMSLGTFWVGEGVGVEWPLDAVSIPFLAGIFGVATLAAIRIARIGDPHAALTPRAA